MKIIHNEEGQGLIEYVLIISLVAIVVLAALTLLGVHVEHFYNNSVNNVASPM